MPLPSEKLLRAKADALACLGAPYKWGGKWRASQEPNTTVGVDCSGFSRWVLGRAGISLPDGSHYQWSKCDGKRDAPRLLDLGFADMRPDGWVDHVVVALGDGTVIEARACDRHLGHLKEACPFNKVVIRPCEKWDKQAGFLGWYGVPGVYTEP